ncbi:MAG: ATP synthase F1 subunit delta [Candidatus Margulisiibacteriota bacterium]
MNKEKRVARVYAGALVRSISDNKKLIETQHQFNQIALLFDDIPELPRYFDSPVITKKKKSALIPLLFTNDNALLRRFFLLLLEKGRINLVPEIKKLLQIQIENKTNQQTANIYSAHELEKEALNKIKKAVSVFFAKEINANHYIDKSIGSGIRVEAGGYVIDNSTKKRLSVLADIFK